MSIPMYEPLQAVAPITGQHVRMGWLLQARQAARRALDAVLAAPGRAAGYVSRLAHKLHLDAAVSWLRRTGLHVTRPLGSLARHLGRSGLLAAVTAVVSSPSGRAVVVRAARTLGKTLSWLVRTAYSGLDRGLRCFGAAGDTVADRLLAGVVALGGRVATVAAPVVHRVARLSDPATPQARLLSALCRSYVRHRTLTAFVGNAWLRLLVEAVLVPAVLDSRLVAGLRAAVQEARMRAELLHEQADSLAVLEVQEQAVAPEAEDLTAAVSDDDLAPGEDVPIPSNRAERRAAERQQRRNQQH
jgi:hypothetical protein